MTSCLFVYGTLMRGAAQSSLGRAQRRRLDAAGEWLGPATMPGRLWDKGRYPLMTGPDARLLAGALQSERVHGEIYLLGAPGEVFAWLDPYEGIPAGATRGDEYERVTASARLADGRDVDAWVYRSTFAVVSLPRVADGRWRPR